MRLDHPQQQQQQPEGEPSPPPLVSMRFPVQLLPNTHRKFVDGLGGRLPRLSRGLSRGPHHQRGRARAGSQRALSDRDGRVCQHDGGRPLGADDQNLQPRMRRGDGARTPAGHARRICDAGHRPGARPAAAAPRPLRLRPGRADGAAGCGQQGARPAGAATGRPSLARQRAGWRVRGGARAAKHPRQTKLRGSSTSAR